VRMTVYAGWLLVIVGIVIGAGAFLAGQPGFGGIMLASLGGTGAFMVWLGQGWDKPLEDSAELYKYGRPANATILSVADEQLRPDGVRLAKLTLHVTPRNESDYKTTRLLALPKGRVPTAGERVTVKFDPQSRKNVVLLEEAYEVEDHLQAAARQMRATFS
jgi:hypothetical protein